MQRRPEITYRQSDDIILYERKDGQRIIAVEEYDWTDRTMVYNALASYAAKNHIDYIVCRNCDYIIVSVAKSLDIPIQQFDIDTTLEAHAHSIRDRQMFLNGLPTCGLIFCDRLDEDSGVTWISCLFREYNVPVEIVHH